MPEGGFRTGLLIGALAAAVVGLAVALVITSGDEASEPSTVTTTSTEQPPTTTTEQPPTTSTEQPPTTATEAAFTTPSGNIVCRVTPESATCAAIEFTYTAPPVPADCDVPGWGHTVTVADASGQFVCRGDPPANLDSPALPYGEGVLVGPFACGSSEAGVRCAHRDTGHGFQVARERVRLF